MRIEVTQIDIDISKHRSVINCPIAKCLKRCNIPFYMVTTHCVYTHPDMEQRDLVPLPPEALQFVRDFDNNLVVKPFSFELAL